MRTQHSIQPFHSLSTNRYGFKAWIFNLRSGLMSNTKMKSNPLVFLWKTTSNRLLQYKISHKIEYTSSESEDSNQLTATNLNIPTYARTFIPKHIDKPLWCLNQIFCSCWQILNFCPFFNIQFSGNMVKKRGQKIERSILPDTDWLFLWSMDVTKLSNWQIWASSDNMFASQYLQIDGVYESQHGEKKKTNLFRKRIENDAIKTYQFSTLTNVALMFSTWIRFQRNVYKPFVRELWCFRMRQLRITIKKK